MAEGCSAPQVWKKDGISLDQSNKIRNNCSSEASMDGKFSNNELKQRFSLCMKNNGFRRSPQWDDAPVNPWVDKDTPLW